MLKTVLIDDESLTISALKRIIEQYCQDVTVIGEANNGIQALEVIQNLKPDFIIIDVRMPHMDGIEVIKNLYEKNTNVKIIVLSAHREFEYAQKALQYGANAFVLKPLVSDYLVEEIAKIKSEIVKEIETARMENKANEIVKEQYLKLLVSDTQKGEKEALPQMCDLDAKADDYQVLILRLGKDSHGDAQMYSQYIVEKISLCIHEYYKGEVFFHKNNEIVIIIYHAKKISSIIDIAFQIKQIAEQYAPDIVMIGISRLGHRLYTLYEAYNEAEYALQYMFYLGYNAIIEYDKIGRMMDKYEEDLLKYETNIAEKVKLGIRVDAYEVLDLMFEKYRSKRELIPNIIYKSCYNMIMLIVRELNPSSMDDRVKSEFIMINLEDIKKNSNIEELYLFMKEAIGKILDSIEKERESKDVSCISKVKKYCESNYYKDITLDMIADYVYMNKTYFCGFFKEKTGETFWSYLTNLRMEKAKHLLIATEMKINDIVEKVGYKNPSHFSRIFKDLTGLSPAEYRKRA